MKAVSASVLFAGLATAHSGVWTIKFDGNLYPARDARIDDELGARRIEWKRGEKVVGPLSLKEGNAWNPITDVTNQAITCGRKPVAPELNAVARAGSNVTIQWSGMQKMHNGPVLSYLGALPSPNTKPQDVSFFKIAEAGYDKKRELWANEDLINDGYKQTIQLPSDIKPGMYILRTELVALHSNKYPKFGGGGAPQFFTHCFNVDIKGDGTATPPGVKFPGGYSPQDPGIKFNLYTSEAAWDNYIIPGPPLYKGRFDAPVGPQPVLTMEERGSFPPEFEVKYQEYKAKIDRHSMKTAETVNPLVPGGKGGVSEAKGADLVKIQEFYKGHYEDAKGLDKDFDVLKKEAIRLGIIKS